MIFKASIKPDFFDSEAFTTNQAIKKIIEEFLGRDCRISSISEKKVLGSKNKISHFYFILFTSSELNSILSVLNKFKERITFHEIEELK